MGIFSIFTRKVNKKAKSRPNYASDYRNDVSTVLGADSTSFACIDRIASEFAGLNFAIYDKTTHQKVTNHPIYDLLKQPNLEERHFNFFYQSGVDYYNGGCYWLKMKFKGEVVSLFRLNPYKVTPGRDIHNKRVYIYNGKYYYDDEILYIPSRFCYSTLRGGQSIFEASQNVFDTADKVERYTQKSFENGLNGSRLVIDIEKALPDATEEQLSELKANFQSEYTGSNNAGRPLIKKNGINYEKIDIGTSDNRAVELSENRKLQEHEISKVFGVPEDILTNKADSNIENVFIYFNEFAIRPMATQFQEVINSLLDENRYYFEFDYNGLMKVSLSQRIDAYQKEISTGILSINDARKKENLPPVEEGDTIFMPVNYMPWNKETKDAYMAKQKQTVQEMSQQSEHFLGGDDKA